MNFILFNINLLVFAFRTTTTTTTINKITMCSFKINNTNIDSQNIGSSDKL